LSHRASITIREFSWWGGHKGRAYQRGLKPANADAG
jgi:hypothetical protein